jgi:cytochrome c oxidase assembly protein subunit 15
MFFVFIIPFPIFLWRGMLTRELRNWLVAVVMLAGLEGFFGWIMVASGLRERPWVNAYNLTLHLCMGVIIFCTLLWTAFIAFKPAPRALGVPSGNKLSGIILGIAFFQIALGAMMSGAKAGLFYPTWPDMRGEYLPAVLLDPGHWQLNSFLEYDTNPFMPALIQFLHRNTAYILTTTVLWFFWKGRNQGMSADRGFWSLLLGLLALQVTLGIVTLINCTGSVPVDLGVYHQACAVLLIGVILWSFYRTTERAKSV